MTTLGRKIVYTSKGAAKGVITNDVHQAVRYEPEYYELSSKEIDKAIEKLIENYEIVEYTPKGK